MTTQMTDIFIFLLSLIFFSGATNMKKHAVTVTIKESWWIQLHYVNAQMVVTSFLRARKMVLSQCTILEGRNPSVPYININWMVSFKVKNDFCCFFYLVEMLKNSEYFVEWNYFDVMTCPSVVVCSLYVDEQADRLLSGSWDNSAIVWPITEATSGENFQVNLFLNLFLQNKPLL